jgi:hypothetical protein
MKTLLVFLLAFSWSWPWSAPSKPTVSLAWLPNKETNIAHYTLYYGTASGVYQRMITTPETIATVQPAKNKTTYFSVTATNTSNKEGAHSAEIHWP